MTTPIARKKDIKGGDSSPHSKEIILSPREQLIERILHVPEDRLPKIETFLHSLECGDASPLSIPSLSAQPSSLSPTESQKSDGSEDIESGNDLPHSKDWPHAPVHRLSKHGTYIVTAGTLYKQHFFRGLERLTYLEKKLLSLAKQYGWQLEAWAVFSNHYHFVAHGLPGCDELNKMLKHRHGETATEVNRLDDEAERQVWFNFWDTQLTFEKSYLARLNYVHQNPVKHGLVKVANQYRWCSAAWFERTASPAQIHTIYSFKTSKVNVLDDFEPV
jgi:putative transposase